MTAAYDAVHDATALVDLDQRGRLLVTGEDAGRLLHAISTNDVKNLAPGQGLYAFFLNAQGRILGDAYIFRRGDTYLLDTEPETANQLLEHIDKYIIADDAAVQPVEGWATIGIEGPFAAEVLTSADIPVPEQPLAIAEWGEGLVARVASCVLDGFRVIAPVASCRALQDALISRGVLSLPPEEARAVRIENGIPRYGEDISERYLVQETGQLQAVHFNKGCYLGQEIVERVRSRAQVHRNLHAIRIQGEEAPAPGTKLRASEKDVGEITSAAFSPRLQAVAALAYLRTEVLDSRPTLIVAGSGAEAAIS